MTVKAGDVVKLKSGGSNMVVLGTAGNMGAAWKNFPNNFIVAEWMDEFDHKMVDAFDPVLLMFADTDPAIGCG